MVQKREGRKTEMGRKSRLKSEAKEERLNNEIELYTITETAKMLRVHPATVRNWIKQGKVKPIELLTQGKTKKYRIERKELDRIIKAVS